MRRPGGLKKGRKKFDVDEDLVEGLGRAHDEEFLKLDDASESDSDGEKDNPVFNLQVWNRGIAWIGWHCID